MEQAYQPIADLLQRVRARWRGLLFLRAVIRGALVAAAVLAVTLIAVRLLPAMPLLVAIVGAGGLLLTFGIIGASLWPLRQRPTDAALARYVEERVTTLDERLISAVAVAASEPSARPVFASAMVADAARALTSIDATTVITAEALRRHAFQAAGAVAVLLAVAVVGRASLTRTYDAATLALFPATINLQVTPGDARVEAGTGLDISARLVGNGAPVVPQLQRMFTGDDEWQAIEMPATPDGRFALTLDALTSSFQYRVVAGGATSKTFSVSVVRAPRVARIDIDYEYPKAFGLAPRKEQDGGDVYGPAGTKVTLRIQSDLPAATAQMSLGEGTIALAREADGKTFVGSLVIQKDDAYRVALDDGQGLRSKGDTEYFIRTMDDRPPEVHVTEPASDRRVTPLEEVDIEAEAADDFGVASLDLVYAVRGGAEKVVPLRIPAQQTSVTGRHVLYLEDLDVRPGDFVSYYVRARDVARGRRSVEARSDIFFLEIKNFEEEFSLAQSQAAAGGGASNPQLDELVAAQKEVIVATWKLDRRSQGTNAQSAQDIRAIAKAESDLKTRVERVATSLRTSTMRDPRARNGRGQPAPRGPQRMTEEEAMTAAAAAMTKAAESLNALKTSEAIAPEMEALNRLLEAQSDIKKREVQRQQAGAGSGSNRATQDLSSLFDKELSRNQETNYENASSAKTREQEQAGEADRIRDLAKRQDELLRRQQDLAARRAQMTPADVKRELERLTREQDDLRKRAEEVAQEISRRQNGGDQSSQQQQQNGQREQQNQQSQGQQGQQSQSQQSAGQQSGQNQQGQQSQQGQQNAQGGGTPNQNGNRQPTGGQPQQGAQAQNSQNGQRGQEGGAQGQSNDSQRRLREATEEMRASAGELQRDSPEQAAARGQRALDRLRDLQQQLDGGSPEGRRRALGDLQLEARQLADAQRQLADAQRRAAQSREQNGGQNGGNAADTLRRLAGEQERLADRLDGVRQRLRQQAQAGSGAQGGDSRALQQSAGDAGREIERQRLTERMQQSASAMREQASQGSRGAQSQPGQASQGQNQNQNGQSQSGQAQARQGQGQTGQGQSGTGQAGAQGRAAGTPQAQEDIARALDRIAERLASGERGRDGDTDRLAEQRARAQELRERLNDTTERLADLDRQAANQNGAPGQNGRGAAPDGQATNRGDQNQPGTQGPGQGTGQTSQEIARLREEMTEQMNELRQLVGDARRDGGQQQPGGVGSTFEGQGMVLSAPGTEGFKQDFARWQELKRQATIALESIESSASRRLQAKESQDRLAAAAADRPPAEYQSQVDSYFKALASKKKP